MSSSSSTSRRRALPLSSCSAFSQHLFCFASTSSSSTVFVLRQQDSVCSGTQGRELPRGRDDICDPSSSSARHALLLFPPFSLLFCFFSCSSSVCPPRPALLTSSCSSSVSPPPPPPNHHHHYHCVPSRPETAKTGVIASGTQGSHRAVEMTHIFFPLSCSLASFSLLFCFFSCSFSVSPPRLLFSSPPVLLLFLLLLLLFLHHHHHPETPKTVV